MPTRDEVVAQLTGPGGPFEVVEEDVGGVRMKVYRERMRSLREVAALARGYGDREFLVHGDRRLTYAEALDTVDAVSAALRDRFGVRPGDRVAVLSANNPEWCLTFWATVNLGAVLVGLNGWWKADEVVYGLQDSGAVVLVADRDRFARVADRLGEAPALRAVFLVDGEPPAGDDRVHRFEELTAGPAPGPPTEPIGEDDPAVIFYTSGTTGRPKGAISTHRSMIANLQNTVFLTLVNGMLSGGDGGGLPTASLLTSPLFHVSGCHSGLVVGTLAGIKLVMPVGRFDPEKALRLIQDERITVWATVPTMVWRVCEHPASREYDTSTVTTVAFGGSPSADELQRKVRATFPNVRTTSNAYGLTESSSVATVISGQDALERPASVGRPLPVVDVRIAGPDGEPLPPGRTGEVLIRGPIVMPGYWGKPEATAATVRDGWLHTGDLGHLDGDGFLYITDRAKDMIIRGGENIYCVEIENRLVEHPKIADAAIIGVPHPELGEEVKAIVQVEPGAALTEDEVRDWVRATLADFKVPAHVELRDAPLPRNASGKLLKDVLRGRGQVSFAETM